MRSHFGVFESGQLHEDLAGSVALFSESLSSKVSSKVSSKNSLVNSVFTQILERHTIGC